jgi:hypothetical protein
LWIAPVQESDISTESLHPSQLEAPLERLVFTRYNFGTIPVVTSILCVRITRGWQWCGWMNMPNTFIIDGPLTEASILVILASRWLSGNAYNANLSSGSWKTLRSTFLKCIPQLSRTTLVTATSGVSLTKPCVSMLRVELSIKGIRNCWTEMLARSLGHIIILVHFRSKR